MTESEWLDFLRLGNPPQVLAGKLADELVRFLGGYTDRVLIRHDYALKCHNKHGLRPDHFVLLPIVLEFGAVLYDNSRPRHLSILFHEDAVLGSCFELAIKVTSLGHEMHVCSFHRTRVSEYNRLLRKHDVLRHQKS